MHCKSTPYIWIFVWDVNYFTQNILAYPQYQRLVVRRGSKKAIVAVAHSMLIAIYHVLSGHPFNDLGADYYNQFNTEKKINAYLRKLKNLGWEAPSPAVSY
jgi:transposase